MFLYKEINVAFLNQVNAHLVDVKIIIKFHKRKHLKEYLPLYIIDTTYVHISARVGSSRKSQVPSPNSNRGEAELDEAAGRVKVMGDLEADGELDF